MDLQPALDQRAKVEEFQRKHRIGRLTLLFTDRVGSTRLKQELGDPEAIALIQQHHALVREILAGCFGQSSPVTALVVESSLSSAGIISGKEVRGLTPSTRDSVCNLGPVLFR